MSMLQRACSRILPVRANLPGPSRRITVEPIQVPAAPPRVVPPSEPAAPLEPVPEREPEPVR